MKSILGGKKYNMESYQQLGPIYATITFTFHGFSSTPLFGVIETSIHIYTSIHVKWMLIRRIKIVSNSSVECPARAIIKKVKPDDDRHHRQ